MYFVLALHQPLDPAVVSGSETPQQQTNILQVCRIYQLYREKHTILEELSWTQVIHAVCLQHNVCNRGEEVDKKALKFP